MKTKAFTSLGMPKFAYFGFALITGLIITLAACGEAGGGSGSGSPPKPTVTDVTVITDYQSVSRGGSLQFDAVVNGKNKPQQTVNWSIEGSPAEGTTISASGLLTVDAGESGTTLTVRATSTFDNTKSGTKQVSVTNPPAVTGVTVTPKTANVAKGGTRQFSANITGTDNPPVTVTWSIEGQKTAGTAISEDGLLMVADDETNDTLTVRAVSKYDNTKSDTAEVTVIEAPVLTGIVSIDGVSQVGYTLTANTSNVLGSGDISYQWQSKDSTSLVGMFADIPNATSHAYTAVSSDQNKNIRVVVARTGYSGKLYSDQTNAVAAAVSGSDVSGTVTLSDGSGNVSVNFNNTGALTLRKTGSLTVTITGTYQAYRWFVDGLEITGETSKSLVLSGANYSVGSHRILVIVYQNDAPYSNSINFTVSN